jgi:hypothetical protein
MRRSSGLSLCKAYLWIAHRGILLSVHGASRAQHTQLHHTQLHHCVNISLLLYPAIDTCLKPQAQHTWMSLLESGSQLEMVEP